MKITAELIREVREESGAGVMRAKQVLEEVGGDKVKAVKILREEGFSKLAKRAERETSAGFIATYRHHTGTIAALVELNCETDFVAKNELFIETANNIAMQVASMNPSSEEELLSQSFIKNPEKTIEELIKEVNAKTGENTRLGKFVRLAVGE